MLRRQFLKILWQRVVFLIILSLKPYRIFGAMTKTKEERNLTDTIELLFPDKEKVKTIGRYFLEINPNQSDIKILTENIFSGNDLTREKFINLPLNELKQVLRDQIAEDFNNGKIASFKGWIFSLTEFRLCALVYLG